jgi:hypothetical protein
MLNNIIIYALIGAGGMAVFGCQAPEEPESLKQRKSSTSLSGSGNGQPAAQATVGSAAGTSLAYDPGGVDVGDAKLKKDVSDCLKQGFFYSRNANICRNGLSLAKVNCNEKGITDVMSQAQKDQFAFYKAASLKAVKLDQCLDCSDPSLAECQSVAGNKVTEPGIRMFFVDPSGDGKKHMYSLYINYKAAK